jgi:hypothetical protein
MKGCGLVEVAADCYTTPRLAFDGGASARSPLRHLCRDSRPSEASLSARPQVKRSWLSDISREMTVPVVTIVSRH